MTKKLSRRKFLTGCCALALMVNSPSNAGLHGSVNPGPTFSGNPNAVVSSIGGGITLSRTSGFSPAAFVQASASGVTAVGTVTSPNASVINVSPYSDLSYTWNFGEPNGAELFVNPVTSQTVNINTQQGPEAIYSYRNPGTYTITLTATAANGVSRTFTTTFTVTDLSTISGYNGEFYADSVNGSDSNNGTTPTTPVQTISKLITILKPKSKVFFAQGSHWIDQGILKNNPGTAYTPSSHRFNSYVGIGGAGAKPIIEVATGAQAPVLWSNGAGGFGAGLPLTDIVLSNIIFRVSGSSAAFGAAINIVANNSQDPAGVMNDIYLDQVDAQITFAPVLATNSTPNTISLSLPVAGDMTNPMQGAGVRSGIYGGSATNLTAFPSYNSQGIEGGTTQWMFNFGTSISGAGGGFGSGNTDIIHTHHIYKHVNNNALYKFNSFSNGPNRNYAINIESNPTVTSAGTGAGQFASITGTVSGAAGTGPFTATLTISTTRIGTPTVGQFIANLSSGISAQLTTSLGGGQWTITSNQSLSNIATLTSFTLVPANSSFTATITGVSGSGPSTATLNITSGTITGAVNIGDFICGLPGSGWAQIVSGSGNTFQISYEGVLPSVGSATLMWTYAATLPANFNYFLIDSNLISGTQNGHSGNSSDNNPSTLELNNFVFSNNAITGMGGLGNNTTGANIILAFCVNDYTARDNFYYGNGAGLAFGSFFDLSVGSHGNMASTAIWRMYRNKLYIPSTVGNGYQINIASAMTSTIPIQYTDNIVQDDRATPLITSAILATSNQANSIFARNYYYSAGGLGSASFMKADATTQTFSAWQANGSAFDPSPSSNVTNPGWTVPPTSYLNMGGYGGYP